MIRGTTALIAHLGYPTAHVQGADDLQPLLRAGRASTRWSCRWAARPSTTGVPAVGVHADQHPRRAHHDAAQGQHRRPCSTRLTPAVQIAGSCNAVRRARRRPPAGRPVRRRRLRARRAAQGMQAGGRARARRRLRRRRLGDRGVARRRRRERLDAFRCASRRRRAGLAQRLARALPELRVEDRLERPGRPRPRGQRHAARHEGRRPAADGRGAHRARAPSSARW